MLLAFYRKFTQMYGKYIVWQYTDSREPKCKNCLRQINKLGGES
jgi:hypothetical protein